jgi:hypothetical protein
LPLFPQEPLPLRLGLCVTIGEMSADPLEAGGRGREIDAPQRESAATFAPSQPEANPREPV